MPVAINGCELRHGSGGSYSPSEAGKNQVTLLRPHGCTSARAKTGPSADHAGRIVN